MMIIARSYLLSRTHLEEHTIVHIIFFFFLHNEGFSILSNDGKVMGSAEISISFLNGIWNAGHGSERQNWLNCDQEEDGKMRENGV